MARAPRPSDASRLVTLSSDVGAAYAAQMKAVLVADGVPSGRILDLAHDLPAHAILESAFLVREMARRFPRDSVHLVVVDPGVGGRRRPIVITTAAGPDLVGPDNGVLYPLAQELGIRTARAIDPRRLERPPRVGTTFDGRDVFAPAAARLALGYPVARLGPTIRPTALTIPRPRATARGIEGVVLHIDRFGNVITNVPPPRGARAASAVRVSLGNLRSSPLPFVSSYEALGPGTIGVLGSSFGLLEVAEGRGRAADRIPCAVGAPVKFSFDSGTAARSETANSARPRKRE